MKRPGILFTLFVSGSCNGTRCRVALASLLLLAGATFVAEGGSGNVNDDGTIDFTVYFRYPPFPGDIENLESTVTDASERLWNATEGQIRFGNVTIECSPMNEDLSDVWIRGAHGRPHSAARCDGTSISTPGSHTTMYSSYLPFNGTVFLHEICHLALGLSDEYAENCRHKRCYNIGPCVDAPSDATCIMQDHDRVGFCTVADHDLLQGDGWTCNDVDIDNSEDCPAGPVPCEAHCEAYNLATQEYETTEQQRACGADCWSHMLDRWDWLQAPDGQTQGVFVQPTFLGECDEADVIALVLDRSNSMNFSSSPNEDEICDNGIDDDGNDGIDESDCAEARSFYLVNGADAYLQQARTKGLQVGIVSFATAASIEQELVELDLDSYDSFLEVLNELFYGGNTSIGSGLEESLVLFDPVADDPVNKAVLLISDGRNNRPPEPEDVVADLEGQGVRVYTIGTGPATNFETLGYIAQQTKGKYIEMSDPTALVAAFVQHWARYRNEGILIPKLGYVIDADSVRDETHALARGTEQWIDGMDWPIGNVASNDPIPGNNYFKIWIEEGTTSFTIALAGNMGNMSGFGVRAVLETPPGSAPEEFDTEIDHPAMAVSSGSGFLLVTISDPTPGEWFVDVTAASGAAPIQTGNITVISENPETELFASLDRGVVNDPAVPLTLNAVAIHHTELHGVDFLEAVVQLPDGSLVPLDLVDEYEDGSYSALIDTLPTSGAYEVRVRMKTGPGVFNDPGESIFPGPENTIVVPVLERTATAHFFVTTGPPACTHENDCDGDGVDNDADRCSSSDTRSTLVIGDTNSYIRNPMLPTGCTLADLLNVGPAIPRGEATVQPLPCLTSVGALTDEQAQVIRDAILVGSPSEDDEDDDEDTEGGDTLRGLEPQEQLSPPRILDRSTGQGDGEDAPGSGRGGRGRSTERGGARR